MPERILVNDDAQQGYEYVLTAREGQDYDPDFQPELTPAEMLKLGVFGGQYLNACRDELPASWFREARLSDHGTDPAYNFFEIGASQPIEVWQAKGWIHDDDPRGWFQWYARYYLGRRLGAEDQRQIKRWKAFRRHAGQIKAFCHPGDMTCRRRQRQALLHWAYDSRKI